MNPSCRCPHSLQPSAFRSPDLLAAEPPSRRAALEITLERAQQGSLYQSLGLPYVYAGRRLPIEALEAIVGLYEELVRRPASMRQRRKKRVVPTPSCARRCGNGATTSQRSKRPLSRFSRQSVTMVVRSRSGS